MTAEMFVELWTWISELQVGSRELLTEGNRMCSTEHMSTDLAPKKLTRYRFLEGHPEKLTYPSGNVLISFRADPLSHDWFTFAAKESDPTKTVEIVRAPSMLQWAHTRFQGFDVETGSPADKIMQKLVREGGAVVMQPNETFYPGSIRSRKSFGR